MVIAADDSPRLREQTGRMMTSQIDIRASHYDVPESLVLHVDAAPDEVLRTVDRLGRDPHAGFQAIGSGGSERLCGLKGHPLPGPGGRVDIIWDLQVEPDGDGGSYLSSQRFFVAADETARPALLSQWRSLRPLADTLARRAVRVIKRTAEERSPVAARAEMALAA